MNIFEINTTSDNSQNFYLMTDVSMQVIELIISKMVQDERAEGSDIFYVNEDYVNKIKSMIPSAVVVYYEKIPLIKI